MTEENVLKQAWAALDGVHDPEIRRPITELGMVDHLSVDGGTAQVTVLLTVAGCPMRNTIERDVTAALSAIDGITSVEVTMGTMTDEQRQELSQRLRGGQPEPVIPFTQPGNTTQVIVVSSGKGGVGKSSVTVNLALSLAKQGAKVGLLDADIYGHSIPDLLGVDEDARPTLVDGMIMPVPCHYDFGHDQTVKVSVISMGMLKESKDQVIAWRGPILDRALTQLLSEVYWGDLDYFLIDLPPGTGDVAMSIGQKLPNSELIVVTTPQPSVAWVSERAGTMGLMMKQKLMGVVENMSWYETVCPNCDKPHRVELFGSGGGQQTAANLTEAAGREVPLLAQIPMDPAMGAEADMSAPIVIEHPDNPAAQALDDLAGRIRATKPSLVGKPLGLRTT